MENRSWIPPVRLLGTYIAIHAGLHYDDHWTWPAGWSPPGGTPTGIVAVVRLAGALDTRFERKVYGPSVGPELTTAEREKLETLDSDPWWVGPVGWFLTEPVSVGAVDCKGALGLWEVPMQPATEVRRQWIEARERAA